MGRFLKTVFLVLFWLALLAGGFVAYEAHRFLTTPASDSPQEIIITIAPGATFDRVAWDLKKAGAITDVTRFRLLARAKDALGKVRAGEYTVNTGWTPEQVLKQITEGRAVLYRLSVREGLTWWETARAVEEQGFATYEDFKAVIHDPEFLKEHSIPFENAEGFLYPETYLMKKPRSPLDREQAREVAATMVRMFWKKTEPIWKEMPVAPGVKPDASSSGQAVPPQGAAPADGQTPTALATGGASAGQNAAPAPQSPQPTQPASAPPASSQAEPAAPQAPSAAQPGQAPVAEKPADTPQAAPAVAAQNQQAAPTENAAAAGGQAPPSATAQSDAPQDSAKGDTRSDAKPLAPESGQQRAGAAAPEAPAAVSAGDAPDRQNAEADKPVQEAPQGNTGQTDAPQAAEADTKTPHQPPATETGAPPQSTAADTGQSAAAPTAAQTPAPHAAAADADGRQPSQPAQTDAPTGQTPGAQQAGTAPPVPEAAAAPRPQRPDQVDPKAVKHLLIMASLVEKETGVPSERARVAGVYANRLRLGMLLQCDPTIIYGVGESFTGAILRSQLNDAKNKYNTYQHPGLPPGPICSSGLDALMAAFKPEKHEYLYFVATGLDASHTFSKTLNEHNKAVQIYRARMRAKQ